MLRRWAKGWARVWRTTAGPGSQMAGPAHQNPVSQWEEVQVRTEKLTQKTGLFVLCGSPRIRG